MTYCLLVPHFNHQDQLIRFLPKLLATGLDCIIVDDGSHQENLNILQSAVEGKSQIHLCLLPRNRGKGGAVKAGFLFAANFGFSHAIQIDADGQHDLGDLDEFIRISQTNPDAIICGKPVFDSSAPKARLYGRKVTDFWVALETLSLKIKDGLCGFRVYPLAQCEKVIDHYFLGNRMDFDTEFLVKAVWFKTQLIFVKTHVIYPDNNISHFNYLRDNLLLIRLHSRLMAGMLIRLPLLIWHRLRGY